MRSVSEPICSRMGPRAGKSASGMCSEALLWKVLAGHLGRRAPKDLTAPRTWLTSCVRQPTNAAVHPKFTGTFWNFPICVAFNFANGRMCQVSFFRVLRALPVGLHRSELAWEHAGMADIEW